MALILFVLGFLAFYIIVVVVLIKLAWWGTSRIKIKGIKNVLRFIAILIAPCFLFVDLAVGVPVLKLTCAIDGGIKIYEPFKGDTIIYSDIYFSGLRKDFPNNITYCEKDCQYNHQGFVTNSFGKLAALYDTALETNTDFFHFRYYLTDLNDKNCVSPLLEDKRGEKFSDHFYGKCVAAEFIDKFTTDYVYNKKPYLINSEKSSWLKKPSDREKLDFGFQKHGANITKNEKIVAEVNTFGFTEWWNLTNWGIGPKTYYCGFHKGQYDYDEKFFEAFLASKNN